MKVFFYNIKKNQKQMSSVLKSNNITVNRQLLQQLDNSEENRQLIRKVNRYVSELRQCKSQLRQSQRTLKSNISPQRQRLMQQLVSKHEQITQLSRSQHIKQKQHLKLLQCTQSIRKQISQQQTHLLQTIQHKQQLNTSIIRVQNEINHLKDIQKQLLVIQATKQQQINDESQWRQQQLTQKIQQLDYNKQRKQEQMKNAAEFNVQCRDCLEKRMDVKGRIQQAVKAKMEEIARLQEQGSILKGNNLLYVIQASCQDQNSNTQQSYRNSRNYPMNTNSNNPSLLQSKSRLQILKHTLKQQIQQSTLLQHKIYHNHQLSQESIQADQQANQMLQKIIRIKLEAEYASLRAKNRNKDDNSPIFY